MRVPSNNRKMLPRRAPLPNSDFSIAGHQKDVRQLMPLRFANSDLPNFSRSIRSWSSVLWGAVKVLLYTAIPTGFLTYLCRNTAHGVYRRSETLSSALAEPCSSSLQVSAHSTPASGRYESGNLVSMSG